MAIDWIKVLQAGVNFLGMGSGIAAAIVWYMASRIKLPPMVSYYGAPPENDPFFQALKKGASLNARAALLAAISAICAAISFAYNF